MLVCLMDCWRYINKSKVKSQKSKSKMGSSALRMFTFDFCLSTLLLSNSKEI
jgi:hypothetical protein